MTFVLNTKPNFIVPVFQQVIEGTSTIKIQYKPFASFYQWSDFIDLSPILGFFPVLTDLIDAAATAAAVADGKAEAAQAAADAAQATADDALAAAGSASGLIPSGYSVSPSAFRTISGGFGSANYLNTVWLSTYWLMTGQHSDADIVLPLLAGNYSVEMLWIKGSNVGDVQLYVNGSVQSTAVGYNATSLNAVQTWSLTGLAAGMHTFRLTISGKQAASSGYNFAMSLFSVKKV